MFRYLLAIVFAHRKNSIVNEELFVDSPVETNERKNDVENPWLDPLYRRLSDQKPLAGEVCNQCT